MPQGSVTTIPIDLSDEIALRILLVKLVNEIDELKLRVKILEADK